MRSSESLTYLSVVRIAFPVMLANISVPLVGVVDAAVMGRMPTPDYLAAVSIAAVLFSSIYWIFGFLRLGTGGLIAQSHGRGDSAGIGHTLLRNLLLALVIGALILISGRLWLSLGMMAMDVPERITNLVATYFFIRLGSAPATLMLYVIMGTLVGLQRMKTLLALQLLLNVTNIALNLVFFNLFDWHIQGVALATIISEWLTLGVGLWTLRHSIRQVIGSSTKTWEWLWDTAALKRLGNISIDLLVRTCCLTFAFYWITVLGSRQGPVLLAANAILLHLLHLCAHLLDGFAHAAETLAGQAYGRRDKQGLFDVVKATSGAATIVAAVLCLVIVVTGPVFIHLLSHDADTRIAAGQYIAWIYLAPLIGVGSFMLDGIFAGTSNTREMRNGMLISLAVFLATAGLFVPLMGNHGIWLAYYALMLARAITLGLWYPRITRIVMTPARL